MAALAAGKGGGLAGLSFAMAKRAMPQPLVFVTGNAKKLEEPWAHRNSTPRLGLVSNQRGTPPNLARFPWSFGSNHLRTLKT